MTFYCFCGISFRVLVCHLKWFFFSLIGGELGENLSTLDHVQRRGFIWQIHVFFFLSFILKKKSLIIFFSIVQGQGLFDSCFLLSLVCLWFSHFLVKEMLVRWHGSFLGKGCKKPWKVIPLYILWTNRKEKNMLIFYNAELSVEILFYL